LGNAQGIPGSGAAKGVRGTDAILTARVAASSGGLYFTTGVDDSASRADATCHAWICERRVCTEDVPGGFTAKGVHCTDACDTSHIIAFSGGLGFAAISIGWAESTIGGTGSAIFAQVTGAIATLGWTGTAIGRTSFAIFGWGADVVST
jgi:hypothetical protein